MSRLSKLVAILSIAALALVACSPKPATSSPSTAPASSKELIIYSGRKDALLKPVLDAFQQETGIKVVLRSGGASELANAIIEEKNSPKGDLFIANDAGTLEKLRLDGLLTPNDSKVVASVAPDLRAEDGSWVGVSGRARVIMYNTTLVKEDQLPKSIFELTDTKWRGQVAVASSKNESMIAQITALRVLQGDQTTEQYLHQLVANKAAFLGGHTDVRKAVGKGEFKIGLVNHYYAHLEQQDGSPVGIIYSDQGEGEIGSLLNVAGVGIIKGAKNLDNAQRFVDYLFQPATQEIFAKDNFEIPVIEGVKVDGVKVISEFKRSAIPLSKLGSELDKTLDMIEKLGLK